MEALHRLLAIFPVGADPRVRLVNMRYVVRGAWW